MGDQKNNFLRTAANRTLFTEVGAVANTDTSGVFGHVGSDVCAVTGFDSPLSTLESSNKNANGIDHSKG